MAIEIRALTESDYEETLLGWWKDWGWTAPPKDMLPQDGTGGFMVLDGDEPVCAGFMYATNSYVFWVDWIVSSKTYRKKPERQQCISLLLQNLTEAAKNAGAKYSYALIKHKGLSGSYEKIGYRKADSYTSEMIKVF
jgi:hypothetical protein